MITQLGERLVGEIHINLEIRSLLFIVGHAEIIAGGPQTCATESLRSRS
jgi:hypothetical protein